jgi:hypothetical protein
VLSGGVGGHLQQLDGVGGGGVGMLHCRDMYEAKRMKSEAGIATSEFSNSVVCGGCSHCHSKLRKWEWEL